MTPHERAVAAATIFNANRPDHFPGRPLMEGLIANAIEEAIVAERERCAKVAEGVFDVLIGHANHGYNEPGGAEELAQAIAKEIRESSK